MRADITTIGNVIAKELPDFQELLRMHQKRVFSIACHFLHDRALAEEAAQDVFLRLFRALPSIKSEEHAVAWLYKVTSHRCIDYARRRRRDLALEDIPEPATGATENDPLMALTLKRAVASLPPKARIVVVLRYQEDMEPEEIARALNWRLNTVKSRLSRALKLLRSKLGGVFGEQES
jgi:RNA polymerase sigma-70 factor (ECF subfamily)